jgi:3-methyladenine DNA glycosylase AlkD
VHQSKGGDDMLDEQIVTRLNHLGKFKTSDINAIGKEYLRDDVDVTELLPHIRENGAIHRVYFHVSLKRIKKYEEQIAFIERHFAYLADWWHVDILSQFLVKAPSFEYVYAKASEYVKSSLPFVRRWGYVIFLGGYQKEPKNTEKILTLFHDDKEYYVQMGEAWLLADLAIYNHQVVLSYIKAKKLCYDIIGKGIQKMCDSFRIDDDIKNKAKELRLLYK